MTQRLALGVTPGTGWRAAETRSMAQAAEAAGFEAIFAGEVNTDALAVAQVMGEATTQIKVGTWVANIYLRHSYLCAQHAALIADATGGRMILGLGVSHQPVNAALGIEMKAPIEALRQYTTEVAAWLRGEGPATHLKQLPAAYEVPLYLGAPSDNILIGTLRAEYQATSYENVQLQDATATRSEAAGKRTTADREKSNGVVSRSTTGAEIVIVLAGASTASCLAHRR